MIELLRNAGESIIVGNVKITVMSVNIANKQVRLGIEAPNNTPVYRAEFYSSLKEDIEKEPLLADISI